MKFSQAKAIIGGANWLYSTYGFNLSKEFVFKDFRQAWNFVRMVTFQRDLMPKNTLNYEMSNLYNKVTFKVPLGDIETVEVIENVYKYSKEGHIKFGKF